MDSSCFMPTIWNIRKFSLSMRNVLFFAVVTLFALKAAFAQTSSGPTPPPKPPSIPAPPETVRPENKDAHNLIADKVIQLCEAGKSPNAARFLEMYKNPEPRPVQLAPLATRPLSGREIARRATSAYVRVGWVYQCMKCSRWHTNLAGGYAIAKDAVATAHHVLAVPQNMRPETGWPVVVRGEDDVLPILSVLTANAASDSTVLCVGVNDLRPLGLSSDVEPGDNVFCLSDPRGHRGMFTSGIVNRITTVPNGSFQKLTDLRLNVSADWAPGSSGAAVLDACGNIIGHVGSVISLYANENKKSDDSKDTPQPVPSVMTVHVAIPSKTVRALLEQHSK
jgi:hypothetical protein